MRLFPNFNCNSEYWNKFSFQENFHNIPAQEKSIIQGSLSTQLTLNFNGTNQFTPTMFSTLQCIISTK